MTYVKQVWVDDVTEVDQAHMNHMEDGIAAADAGGIPLPVVNGQWVKGVGGAPVWAAITAADVSGLPVGIPLPVVNGQWIKGVGGVAAWAPITGADVTGVVLQDGVTPAATRILADKLLAGDAQPAFQINGDGKHQWGPGGAVAPDTDLYRDAPNHLKTDGGLEVAGALTQAGSAVATLALCVALGG